MSEIPLTIVSGVIPCCSLYARWISRRRSVSEIAAHKYVQEVAGNKAESYVTQEYLEELHGEMLAAAANLQFERAAELRDRIAKLRGEPTAAPQPLGKKRGRRKRQGM